MSSAWVRWLDRLRTTLGPRPERKTAKARRRIVLDLEPLEQRAVPAVYTVTGTADHTDPIAGGTGTASDPFQAPSLRSAILAANADAGPDTINVPGGTYQLTIPGPDETQGRTGDLDVTNNMTIQGTGPTPTIIDASALAYGGNFDRVMHIHPPTLGSSQANTLQAAPAVTLKGMTFQNGQTPGDDPRGGGILNEGDLTITNCVIQNNQAVSNNAAPTTGGGVFNQQGALDITNSTLFNNSANSASGYGGTAQGGGLYDYGGPVTITGSVLSQNQAYGGTSAEGSASVGEGGGLFTLFGAVAIQSSTFSNNQANGGSSTAGGQGKGGGLFDQSNMAVTVQDSVFSNNLARGGDGFFRGGRALGGAIAVVNGPGFSMSNSTVSGNRAIGGGFSGGEGGGGDAFGGGIYSINSTSITNTTIAFNEADGGTQTQSAASSGSEVAARIDAQVAQSFARVQGGGYFDGEGDPATFESTILAKNTINGGEGSSGPDIQSFGTIQSNGFNLVGIGDGSAGGFTNGVNNDQVGTTANPIDPLLGPLQNNGGPTFTHALLPGSPAINAGDNPNGLQFDQREAPFARTVGAPAVPGGDGTDIGAFEVQSTAIATVFTTFSSKVLFLGSNISANGQSTLLANTLFVNGLYHQLLNRAPDQAGVNNWVFLLESGASRVQIATDLWQSPEHRGLQVDSLYAQILHRPADATGRASWVNAFLAGASETDVARALLLSPEYQSAHASDTAFVTGLYADVLGRSATGAEVAVWTNLLGTGTTRAAVAQAFLTSPEYEGKIIQQYYMSILGRTGSAAEIQSWVQLIQHGTLTLELAGELILASNEYFAHPT